MVLEKSTPNYLVRLEYFKRYTSVTCNREHAISILFRWKRHVHVILWNLVYYKAFIILVFVDGICWKDRHFNVRLGSILSDRYEQGIGIPQGSILMVTLLCISINSLIEVSIELRYSGQFIVICFCSLLPNEKYKI